MTAFLAAWPWERLGMFKYLLCLPILAAAFRGRDLHSNFYYHIAVLTIVRCFICASFQIFSRMLPLVASLKIRPDGLSYEQVDREEHWDNHLILQALILSAAHKWLSLFNDLPLWNGWGMVATILLHVGPAEFLYYWIHRAFHTKFLYDNYHGRHHESVTPEPATAGSSTFLEQLVLVVVMAVPVLGSMWCGGASLVSLYAYLMAIDFLRSYGHSNVEMVPEILFRYFPPLRYLIYTPSYHILHHESRDTNFCLFMPVYDLLGGTFNKETVPFHRLLREGATKERVPDFVFLLHAVDFQSALHVHFLFRTYASRAYRPSLIHLVWWPVVPFVALAMFIWGTNFKVWNYYLRERFHQVWIVPRFGFMYFLPFAHKNINRLIEQAILDADRLGVKVISLAALNKNEALNGGGSLFVRKHPNLRVRVCHGNTLTAAVILKQIPEDVKEVFLTGATSKLGRAISLYLCKRGVRVMMLTASRKRFEEVAAEAPPEMRENLVQVTKHQAGKNCQTWVLGKWLSYSEQKLAPAGTHFHQFVVPPVIPFRRDCTYGRLAAMRLPQDARGLVSCEYNLDRNVVHACHAGGVVHALEGWTHHEVGALDVDRIDLVWEAALKHGLTPA